MFLLTQDLESPSGIGRYFPLAKNPWRSALTLALLTSGLLLSHYFAAMLLAAFLGLLVLVNLVQGWLRFPKAFVQVSWLLNSAAVGLLLAAPWLWRVARYSVSNPAVETSFPESFGAVLTVGSGNYIWQLLGPVSNHWLLLPAGVGLLLALLKRHTRGFALWSLVLALMTLPSGLTVRPFRSDHFVIVLFLPLTLLVGWLLWLEARWAGARLRQRWVSAQLVVLAAAGWAAWGFTSMRYIVNPVTMLVIPGDIEALDWVAENTPEEARFYINTAHWLNNVFRGVDGGGWLLPYTGRWALVPSVFYGFSPDRAWNETLRGWGKAASEITTCSEAFWSLVEEAELDWVYIRVGVGSLQPGRLAGCEGVDEAYRNEEVIIYWIRP